MSDKYFLDTNILIYSFDTSNKKKASLACKLISNALQDNTGSISWQVVQEFLNVATRKFHQPLTVREAKDYLQKVLAPLCEIYPDPDIYEAALDIQAITHYAFYDSLIISSALKGECSILYSEDMHSGHKIRGLEIINPF